jgi:hypothetical protein
MEVYFHTCLTSALDESDRHHTHAHGITRWVGPRCRLECSAALMLTEKMAKDGGSRICDTPATLSLGIANDVWYYILQNIRSIYLGSTVVKCKIGPWRKCADFD